MNSFLSRLPLFKGISCIKVQPEIPFLHIANSFSREPGSVVLLSGTSLDCARYNIMAVRPWLTLSVRAGVVKACLLGDEFLFEADPFDLLQEVVSKYNLQLSSLLSSLHLREKGGIASSCHSREKGGIASSCHSREKSDLFSSCYTGDKLKVFSPCFSGKPPGKLPVLSGFFGYFAYDVKDYIEDLPNTCMDQNLPDIFLCVPSHILINDRFCDSYHLLKPDLEASSGEPIDLEDIDISDQHQETISPHFEDEDGVFSAHTSSFSSINSFSIDPGGFKSNFSKPEYMASVEKIIDYIKAGDIYQVNLSQRFTTGFKGDPYSLFLRLFEKNPAPFFSYINAGDHQVISTSPERFIHQSGKKIETRPIKGTIQRGKNDCEDKQNGDELLGSTKDDAELSMIVDLMRNDFGKVAVGESVIVKEHKRLEPYDNVFHLVSIVEGELASDKSGVDLIKASFPGGSITGCPKIRSMEIIDELESVRRHVYTGSVGYISFHDTMDLSIAIRTAVVAGGEIGFSVGGGIVFDSDPEKEYEETLHKGKTLLETLFCRKKSLSDNILCKETPSSKVAWVNGKIVEESQAAVPASFPGFQYGAGIFETIRVQKGSILRLDSHIRRLANSWKSLFNEQLPALSWDYIIKSIVELNGLDSGVAAVKIVVALSPPKKDMDRDGRGISVSGKGHFFGVFARPYSHRLLKKRTFPEGGFYRKDGLDVVTYPVPRHTPIAEHKSLNYMYYYLAGLYAKEKGFDEALVMNTDGTVSETNTCALMVIEGKNVFLPISEFALPSVTLSASRERLVASGYNIIHRKMTYDELCGMENVIALNALMGAVRVISIDGRKLSTCHNDSVSFFCEWLNRELLIVV
ncbi:Anthranilate synthase [Desulfamplus magnetovallimortis]|uniref:Anthranilate synthase n=1 Tax=Desulfamplus magnetovallimortis TaxID=1246637 RepID=A0A1W1HA21_9BACT|nr:chorismate-binding protein [Desulfamplus magnetovallimortis]SLM29286.1 Anthranilate synthase [Desulfamplus magnetovallimortis]